MSNSSEKELNLDRVQIDYRKNQRIKFGSRIEQLAQIYSKQKLAPLPKTQSQVVLNSEDQFPSLLPIKNPKKKVDKKQKKIRVSNYTIPNLVREVKQSLSNVFPGKYRRAFEILLKMFKKFNIKYQIWAFDAILLCLLYLRDKTKLLPSKKYGFVLDAIALTLEKYKDKKLNKIENCRQQHKQIITKQYDGCIKHLKVYEDENNTFDRLYKEGETIRDNFFEELLILRKLLRVGYLRIIKNIYQNLSNKQFVQEFFQMANQKVEES